jgi:NADP-dependent 3-hydroxy acid dehydrogenase YdfG
LQRLHTRHILSFYETKPYAAIDVTRPELSAADKVVLITGGSAGLGFAFAEHYAKAGCTKITITGRRQQILDDAKSKIEKQYPHTKVLAIRADVTDRSAVSTAFQTTNSTFGPVNVLINNAGYLPAYEFIGQETSAADWWSGFEINVRGSHNVLCAFLPVAAPDATVINLVSSAVSATIPGQSPYTSSKVATTRIFEVFQAENPGLRVINIAPGIVLTDMHQKTIDYLDTKGWPQPSMDDSELANQILFEIFLTEVTVELPGSYMVWASSPEAAFLKGKFVWVHWDVEELREVIDKSEDRYFLKLAVNGLPNWSL